MLRGSSLCAWLYTLVLSLLNGVVGGGLVALCYKSFSTPTHEIGIVLRMCLVTGIVMVVFVFFWIIFIFCTWMVSGQVTQECQSKKEKGTTRRSSSQVTSLLGLLSLILLTISIMVDLSMTGLMWWTTAIVR
jgi:flagellar biosynthesis component FlhA